MTKPKSFIITLILSACFLLSACTAPVAENIYNNTVTALDVGQAACTLIESDGQFALIDAGDDGGNTDIMAYLYRRNVKKIDLLVISHFHHDHTSSMMDVIRNFEIGTVIIPDLREEWQPDTYFYRSLFRESSEGYYALETASQGKTYQLGRGTVTILADTINHLSENDTSVVLSYTDGDFVYVNTADCEKGAEKLLTEIMPENVTLFAAGHHGSYTSNTYDFIAKLNPSAVTISCGENSEYGHPHSQTLNTFDSLGIPYHITYQMGNIIYSIDKCEIFAD
ncbi:MAG: MBL fold metallo-hydrolase [Oscillospiraceae bacterium]|nr:MBL fold metallo-hydrolase [Oscillospiraceae bacterium]